MLNGPFNIQHSAFNIPRVESSYGADETYTAEEGERPSAPQWSIEGPGPLIAAIAPLIATLLALQLSGSWPLAAAILVVGYGIVALITRHR
ncbi:MAG: hypothetical protein WCI67_20755 [Chloroflexales bacterium]